MQPTRDVQKFWKALVAAGGSMTRVILRRNVFGSNRSSSELDSFLRSPLLSGLVNETRERDCKTGRPSRRYILTPTGWEAARLWQLPMSDNLGLEVVREFERGWLPRVPLGGRIGPLRRARQAAGSQAASDQRTGPRSGRRELEEWKAAHPIVKYPSKGRNRSPREEAQRAAWREAHFRKPARYPQAVRQ